MKVAGFPTSSDIYLEVDGKKVAVVQSYTAKSSRTSQTVEAFGEDEPVATIPGPRNHVIELTRLYATDEAVRDRAEFSRAGGLQPGHLQAGPEDHLLRLPVERHRRDRGAGRHGGGEDHHCTGTT